MNYRMVLALVALATLVAGAGCLEMDVRATVGGDGSLEEYRTELVLDEQLYLMLDDQSNRSIEEEMRENITADGDGYESADVEAWWEDDKRHIVITMTGVDPASIDGLDIRAEDGEVTYTHDDPFNLSESGGTDSEEFEGYGSAMTFRYTVEMPGEIRETNSDDVDEENNTVTWRYTGESQAETVRVVSDDGSVFSNAPGFGAAAAVAALLLAGLFFARRR